MSMSKKSVKKVGKGKRKPADLAMKYASNPGGTRDEFKDLTADLNKKRVSLASSVLRSSTKKNERNGESSVNKRNSLFNSTMGRINAKTKKRVWVGNFAATGTRMSSNSHSVSAASSNGNAVVN